MRLASFLAVLAWAMAGVAQGEERPLRMAKPLELTEGWGTIEGQFVLDGDVPASRPLMPNPVIAGGPAIPDERLLIDSESKGIANVVVYLHKAPLAVHPELKVGNNEVVEFKADNFRFVPHVLHVRTDQRVRCSSADGRVYFLNGAPHVNVWANVPAGIAATFPVGRENGDKEVTMKRPETLPVDVKSDTYAWMQAYWVVTDHPYVGITDEKGRFRIEGLPAGEHAFSVWHEQVGWVDRKWSVEVKSKESVPLPVVKVPISRIRMQG